MSKRTRSELSESENADQWTFVGRHSELEKLDAIFRRGRWFFVKMSGRRRIGKTTLIQKALARRERRDGHEQRVLYVQLPDSNEPGVLSQVHDAMGTFCVSEDEHPAPRTMLDFVKTIEALVRDGYVVVLDEFQYFNRREHTGFCSWLQEMVDRLSTTTTNPKARTGCGGLIVLGSVPHKMDALLEDRSAPLYNRTTDSIDVTHLDIAGILQILDRYAETSPERLLFLWSLFEGVPKFYRDAFEQDVLNANRHDLLRKMFFESSSPLISEAKTWFLSELRGQNDSVLKLVARHPGKSQGELKGLLGDHDPAHVQNVGTYLVALKDKYRLIERRSPIFAPAKSRQGRYYLTDNFLTSWLAAIESQTSARNFRPTEDLVATTDERLNGVEGTAFERLVQTLYEERSRKGLGDFPLSHRVDGYWDRAGVEIDLVAESEPLKTLRFGSCKRNPNKLVRDINNFRGHVERYLELKPVPPDWTVELVGLAPQLDSKQRETLRHYDVIPQDLNDLTEGLRPAGVQKSLPLDAGT